MQLRAKAAGVPVWCRCHRGPITGLVASPNGSFLFSTCSQGTLAQYHCTATHCRVLHVAGQAPVPTPTPQPPNLPIIKFLWRWGLPSVH